MKMPTLLLASLIPLLSSCTTLQSVSLTSPSTKKGKPVSSKYNITEFFGILESIETLRLIDSLRENCTGDLINLQTSVVVTNYVLVKDFEIVSHAECIKN